MHIYKRYIQYNIYRNARCIIITVAAITDLFTLYFLFFQCRVFVVVLLVFDQQEQLKV